MNTQATSGTLKKPALLRTIFILNAVKVLLGFAFYIAFATGSAHISGLDPTIILYTAIGYTVFFAGIVVSILKRNIWALRIIILLDFLSSIPLIAVIGLAISLASLILSFTKPVKAYFAQ